MLRLYIAPLPLHQGGREKKRNRLLPLCPKYTLEYGNLLKEELYNFLYDERDSSKKGVETAVQRMRKFYSNRKQVGLKKWLASSEQP